MKYPKAILLSPLACRKCTGYIHIFQAVPAQWKDVSFEDLRAEGAFLISATKTGDRLDEIRIVSEKRGLTQLNYPSNRTSSGNKKVSK